MEFHFLFPSIIQKNKIAHLAIFAVAAYPDNAEPNFFSFFFYQVIVSKFLSLKIFAKNNLLNFRV